MKYRALTETGDYAFGAVPGFLANSPECVAQAIKTRLLLMQGEWFLDSLEGTPYSSDVLGTHTASTRDAAIRARILDTPGVVSLDSYTSTMSGRQFSVTAVVVTEYGTAVVQSTL